MGNKTPCSMFCLLGQGINLRPQTCVVPRPLPQVAQSGARSESNRLTKSNDPKMYSKSGIGAPKIAKSVYRRKFGS